MSTTKSPKKLLNQTKAIWSKFFVLPQIFHYESKWMNRIHSEPSLAHLVWTFQNHQNLICKSKCTIKNTSNQTMSKWITESNTNQNEAVTVGNLDELKKIINCIYETCT